MNTYTPYPGQAWDGCCQACGSLAESHHTDGRCYTTPERVSRLQWYVRSGRWPGPDEGCDTQETDVAAVLGFKRQARAELCPYCDEEACERSCTGALLAREAEEREEEA